MSLFRWSDYTRKKEPTQRTKLPTINKTSTHKCSQCPNKNAKKYRLTPKEFRWLCYDCIIKFNNRNSIEKPNFVKASKLFLKPQAIK
jgi:transposase-like protein